MKINLFEPHIDKSEERAVLDVLRRKFWASGSGIGKVKEFENKFKVYLNSNEIIAVNSGTAALNLAISLLDIKDKEVIIPSLSFVSTANCVLQNGGIPIFADVEHNTLCLDPERVEELITKKTKAIIPVHFGGMSCKLDQFLKLSKDYKLKIIEDAAHAAGTRFNKKMIGSQSFAVCFSFHPVKNLAMPTGGAISINDEGHRKLRKLVNARRWCGITDRKNDNYEVRELGDNYYMNEISAAIGIKQLSKLNSMNRIRKKIAKRYSEEINLEWKMPFSKDCSYHLYWICVRNRQEFRKKMYQEGIQTGIHYRPIHTFSLYKKKLELSVTEKVGHQIVTLPMHPNLTEKNIDRVIKLANKFSS